MLGNVRLDVGWDGVSWTKNPDEDDVTAGGEDLGHALDGGAVHREVEHHDGAGGRGLIVRGQLLQAAHLGLEVVNLQPVRAFLDGEGHLAPVLGQVLDTLEARDELEADEALLVPLDVLQEELVLGDVGVREIKLNLIKHTLGRVFTLFNNNFYLASSVKIFVTMMCRYLK